MISPEADYDTFIYFLLNPMDSSEIYHQIITETNELIMLYLEDKTLPEPLQDKTTDFINKTVPAAVNAILDFHSPPDQVKNAAVEFFSSVLMLIQSGISEYNMHIPSMLSVICDKYKPFYSSYRHQYNIMTAEPDKATYKRILNNIRDFGVLAQLFESLQFQETDISLTKTDKLQWFFMVFSLIEKFRDGIRDALCKFAEYLNTDKAAFEVTDFTIIQSIFKTITLSLFHQSTEFESIDLSISDYFPFLDWCFDESIEPVIPKFQCGTSISRSILESYHEPSILSFYTHAIETNLVSKLCKQLHYHPLLSDILQLLNLLSESDNAKIVDDSCLIAIYDELKEYNDNASKTFFCQIVDRHFTGNSAFLDHLFSHYSELANQILLHAISYIGIDQFKKIIDFLFDHLDDLNIQQSLKKILARYIKPDCFQYVANKFFILSSQKCPHTEFLSSLFGIILDNPESSSLLLQMIDINREAVLAHFPTYFQGVFDKNTLMKLCAVQNDQLYSMLYSILLHRELDAFESDAYPILDRLSRHNLNDKEDDGQFHVTKEDLTRSFVDFFVAYITEKNKSVLFDGILFRNYKEIFVLATMSENSEIQHQLFRLYASLLEKCGMNKQNINAFADLIMEVLNSPSITPMGFALVVKFVEEYIYNKEFSINPDLSAFNLVRHNESGALNRNKLFNQLNDLDQITTSPFPHYNNPYNGLDYDPYSGFLSNNLRNRENTIPLSVALHQRKCQSILYPKLAEIEDENSQHFIYRLLKVLPDDPSISIVMEEEIEFILSNHHMYSIKPPEFHSKDIIEQLKNISSNKFQFAYQIQLVSKLMQSNNSFEQDMLDAGFANFLFEILISHPTYTSIFKILEQFGQIGINQDLFHAMLNILDQYCEKQDFNCDKFVKFMRHMAIYNSKDFLQAFTANLDFFFKVIQSHPQFLMISFNNYIIPKLCDHKPLFDRLMADFAATINNPQLAQLLRRCITHLSGRIDSDSIFENIILKNIDPKNITLPILQVIEELGPNCDSIAEFFIPILFETSDENTKAIIFSILTKSQSTKIEELMLPYFSNPIKQWNFKPEMQKLGSNEYCGLINMSSTCYLNSIFQILFFTKQFRHLVLKSEKDYFGIQKIFTDLLLSNQKVVDTNPFISQFKGWNNQAINPNEQQDAGEFFQMFIDKLPAEFNELFKGQFTNSYKGMNLSEEDSKKYATIENQEDFFTIQLVIKDFNTLSESFKHFMEPDLLESDNQVYSDSLEKKIDAQKITRIDHAPQFLVIQLKRFEYDSQTRLRNKILTRFEFDLNISINELMKTETDDLNYELYGIILHSGNADFGHYSALVRINDCWYRFNDSEVELFCYHNQIQIQLSTDIFGPSDQADAVPYLLFYRQIETDDEHNYEITSNDLNILKEEYKTDFHKIQIVFSENCLSFALSADSFKLKFAYLTNILSHSRRYAQFQNHFISGLHSSHNFDAEFVCKTVLNSPEHIAGIILHNDSVIPLTNFISETLKLMPIHDIFPYFDYFANNLHQVLNQWRKIVPFTSPLVEFVNFSPESIQYAKQANWARHCLNFIDNYYSANKDKYPIENVNLSNLFKVLQTLLANSDTQEESVVITRNMAKIKQSDFHRQEFANLLISTFSSLFKSDTSLHITDYETQLFAYFKSLSMKNFMDLLKRSIQEAINSDQSTNFSKDYLIVVLKFIITNANANHQTSQAFISQILKHFDCLIPLVFIYPYAIIMGYLINKIFKQLTPNKQIIADYKSHFGIPVRTISQFIYHSIHNPAQLNELLNNMIEFIHNYRYSNQHEVNHDTVSSEGSETQQNEITSTQQIQACGNQLYYRTFFLLTRWIMKNTSYYPDNIINELFEITNEVSEDDCLCLIETIIKIPINYIGYDKYNQFVNTALPKFQMFQRHTIIMALMKGADFLFHGNETIAFFNQKWFYDFITEIWNDQGNQIEKLSDHEMNCVLSNLIAVDKKVLNMLLSLFDKINKDTPLPIALTILNTVTNYFPLQLIGKLVNYYFYQRIRIQYARHQIGFIQLVNFLLNQIIDNSLIIHIDDDIRQNHLNDIMIHIFDYNNSELMQKEMVFLQLIIPRLSADDKQLFLDSISQVESADKISFFLTINQFSRFIEVMKESNSQIDLSMKSVFQSLAQRKFAELEYELASKARFSSSYDSSTESDEQLDLEEKQPISSSETNEESKPNSSSSIQTNSTKVDLQDEKDSLEATNSVSDNQNEFKQNNETIDFLIVEILKNIETIDYHAIAPLFKIKQTIDGNISLIENEELVMEELHNRFHSRLELDFMQSLKLIAAFIKSRPKTRQYFAQKLVQLSSSIYMSNYSIYSVIFDEHSDDDDF